MIHEYIEGNYVDWFDARKSVLEDLLGNADPAVLTSAQPVYMGGGASMMIFREHVPGVTYVTSDLIGLEDQKPNRLGHYELMLCSHDESLWGQNLLSRLASYTLETALDPGATMDIESAVPEGATINALMFVECGLRQRTFKVRGLRSSLLLCLGITGEELAACGEHGSDAVLKLLKREKIFPYTDLIRPSVDLAALD
jgi:hypothetical protein